MFLKQPFLTGAALILFISWLGLELFYFSPVKLEIRKLIQERIKISNKIAARKISAEKFPHVSGFLEENLLSDESGLVNKPGRLAAEYFTQIKPFSKLRIKSVKVDSSKLEMDKKILFYSVDFKESSLASIESALRSISNSPKIINLEQMEIQFAGYGKNGARYHFSLKCSLPFFLESNIHETASL